MAYPYPKKTWVSKEIIKRSALQNIEDGIYDEQQARLREQQEYSQIIVNEVTRATTAEGNLNTAISDEITRATAAESGEVTRATAAENALSDRIDTLSTDISNEVTARINADNALSSQIGNETTRAQQAESALQSYVDSKIGSAYKASGSVYFADLPALADSRVGNVYDVKDAFTTTASFLEGAGKNYPAGTNVVIVNVGTTSTPDLKYDASAGFVDLSNYVQKTDYASANAFGVAKVDGTTVTSNNGVLSAKGGHTIKDASTSFTQRDNLKFENCTVTDDSTNNQTIVSPTVPTVGNGTLTIQKNGTNVQTFTANQSGNATANITVPSKTSDLTNDSGFITSSDIPAIPSKTSDLTNDSGFITSASLPTVNNATLTIQKNGTTVKTFTANASSDVTANITVPTKTSEITNDSNFSVCTYKNATLAQNNTDVTFTGLPTTGNHLYDVYTDKPGLDYIAMEVPQAGQLKVTFEAQSSTTNVYLKITDM